MSWISGVWKYQEQLNAPLEQEASRGASSKKTTLVPYIPDILQSNLPETQQNLSGSTR